jgi:single-stranded-DNA-specific exonuclease
MVLSVKERAKELASIIKEHDSVHVITHIDADGLSAGAIAVETLKRLGKKHSIEFIKQIDSSAIKKTNQQQSDLVWFTDLGSSIADQKFNKPIIITDHHVCNMNTNFSFHLNPHLFDIDGSYMISGSGTTYLVSKAIHNKNKDLSAIAIVGACGDLQNRKYGKLVGKNSEIVQEGKALGVLAEQLDIQCFGRETRPVYKLLQYASDPIIPGISGRESKALAFLKELGIPLKEGSKWRKWVDLNNDERRTILSAIAKLLLSKGFGHQRVKRLIGEVYLLSKEKMGTELHDAKEFATLLNSTARYGEYEIGLQVCLGNRTTYLKKARSLLQGHRLNLVEGMQFAKNEGIHILDYTQYFHAKNGIRDTIIGIVTNMLLNDGETRNDLPLVGFAIKSEDEIKASARASQELIDKGLDLSIVIQNAAKSVNGVGGGHNIAAGATIPKGKEQAFLSAFEKEVKHQLSI